MSVSSVSSVDSADREEDQLYKKLEDIDDLEVDYMQATLVMEGPLKRKVLKRHGKAVSVSHAYKTKVQFVLSLNCTSS